MTRPRSAASGVVVTVVHPAFAADMSKPADARSPEMPLPAIPPAPRPRLPLVYKVLAVNSSIVVVGAVLGTWVTMTVTQTAGEGRGPTLVLMFALIGVVLSVAMNFVVLRAAFRPLSTLELVAEAVREGNLAARAEPLPTGDPQMTRLAFTFNRTLDQLERDRAALRSVASQVITAQEEERKRIARELHDDTAQVLFAQLLRVTALKESSCPEARRTANVLEEMTVEALEGVRRLALELRPPVLDDLGLQPALAGLCQRFGEQLGIPVEFIERGGRGRAPANMELVLYRVAQEALTNAAKHAHATRIVVDLDRTAHDVTLSVRDDGRGFDTTAPVSTQGSGVGLGLFGMVERAALVGGRCAIWSRCGRGTEVFAFIPLLNEVVTME
ncbi:MAG: HAMP domain-containing protein [Thermomicrobiales bacterium]|nr:HAMP domain-containing protein [Thermomicrobiales bacterium]